MDHDRVVETQAVERYLLGDMAPEERDSFEEHYFGCAECAREVRAAARFRANAREVLREPQAFEAPEKGWRRWLAWPSLVPAAASMLLLGVVAYQNAVVIPALRMPQSLSSPLTLDGATRGSLPHIEEGQPLDFLMASPGGGEAGVTPQLEAGSGKVLARGPAVKAVRDEPFHVYFPGKYPTGRYAVVLREPGTERELVRDKFEIVAKETNKNER